MSPKAALRAAFGDLYHQSWRFFLLNACLSAFVLPREKPEKDED